MNNKEIERKLELVSQQADALTFAVIVLSGLILYGFANVKKLI